MAGEPSQTMVLRLLTPITSYSPAGTRFDAKVIGPELREGVDFLPSGSTVTGKLDKTGSVRLGLSRERALLELEFDGCKLPDGTAVGCEVSLEGVDNAREKVTENRIEGVLAASHPYCWLNGFWYRPITSLISHSAMSSTGVEGAIYARFAPTPWGAAAVLASRLVLLRLPDPEIELPAGTDLLARVEVRDAFAPALEPCAPLRPELSEWVAGQPEDVCLPDKKLAGDLIHLVFVGSREQVELAFRAAGWTTSDALTRRSFARMYSAFLAMKADPSAPVAPLTYRGNTAAMVFQKTYNTVAKRHHIRIWPASFAGSQLWLAAATHDTAVALDAKRMSLTHRIDPLIDRERSTVVTDLLNAGCVSEMGLVQRPQAVRLPDGGKPSVTDGNATVLFLSECSAPAAPTPEVPVLQHHRVTLAMRRLVLENRQYLVRGSAFYWIYRAGCTLWTRKFQSADIGE
jgi:LssY C-terminus